MHQFRQERIVDLTRGGNGGGRKQLDSGNKLKVEMAYKIKKLKKITQGVGLDR